jgi:HAD superfamily hydrolase (TIGR01548 family)
MAEYTQATANLQIRTDMVGQVRAAAAVIFDIDGVLLDVRGSFPEVIRETVQYYLKKNYDLDSPLALVTPDDIRQCKLAGGFNNDWDAAEIIASFHIKKIVQYQVKNLLELMKVEPAFTVFIQQVGERGGGLAAARAMLHDGLTSDDREKLQAAVRRAEIVEIFQELYAGANYCQRLYGRTPQFFRGEGKIENEKVILQKKYFFKDLCQYGVLTGRTREETALALERVGLTGQIDPAAVVCDDGTLPTKPQPDGLVKITTVLGSRSAIYCGDTIDDWTAVKSFNAAAGNSMHFCHCLTGSSDAALLARLRDEGADIIAQSVNDLLKWLILQKKGEMGHAAENPQS